MEKTVHRKRIGRLAIVLAAGAVLFMARSAVLSVVGKVALGALFAWLLCPVCKLFERRMGRTASAALSAVMFALALFSFAALLLPPMVRQFSAFSKGLQQALQAGYTLWQTRFPSLQIDTQALLSGAGGVLRTVSAGIFPFLMRSAGSVASFFASFFFSLVLCIYFLRERERFLLYASMLIPLRIRQKCLYACMQVRRELSGYVRGQLIVCACVAALTALGLLVFRVPYAPVLGLLLGALDVIPYFGPIIGVIPILLFSAQNGISGMIWATGVVLLVQQIESSWLNPRVMGSSTGLHPVTVMLGVLGLGTLLGVGGMLAAVPCMLCARAVFRVMRTEP